jgi:hypothetical protein
VRAVNYRKLGQDAQLYQHLFSLQTFITWTRTEVYEFCVCETVDFRRGWTELFRLLDYYAKWGGLKPTFQDYLWGPIFKGQDLDHWRWNPFYSPETSLSNHLISRNNPEEERIQLPVSLL